MLREWGVARRQFRDNHGSTVNAHAPLAAFSATMKARLRKEPGLYCDDTLTGPATANGTFPSVQLFALHIRKATRADSLPHQLHRLSDEILNEVGG